MAKLHLIEGIGEALAAKLQEVGVTSVEALLEAAKTPQGREELAEKTGISGKLILKWVNRADLFRVKGIGTQYSDLLEAAGVDTVRELAQRNAENLYHKLAEINLEKNLVRRVPPLKNVMNWVAQAKDLPRGVEY